MILKIYKKKFFLTILLFISLYFGISSALVAAQPLDCTPPIKSVGDKIRCQINSTKINVPGDNPENFLGIVLKGLFSFLAVLFFLLIIYGGVIWMTAQGNDQKTAEAKKIIIASTIGIAIIFTSYLITVLIITLLRPPTA